MSLYDYCVEHNNLTLLQQWYPLNNGPLTTHSVTYGSRQKVWWRCERGHEWKTSVYTRTGAEAKCLYCAGKRVSAGENDLTSQRPDIAAQWNLEKNGTLTPDSVSVGSHRAVWWVCEKGHEWRAMVKIRVAGCGCPACTNRTLLPGINDLASVWPELARQWHPTKNGSMTPADVLAGTHRKVWWQCGKGHEWQAMVSSRASGVGCPYCAGKAVLPGENDLASNFPAIAAQWNSEKNDGLKLTDVTPTSNRKVWCLLR